MLWKDNGLAARQSEGNRGWRGRSHETIIRDKEALEMNSPCIRCGGFVLTQYGETRCLICAWYYNPPLPDPLIGPRDHNRCVNCAAPRQKYSTLCKGCSIAEGMAVKRGRG